MPETILIVDDTPANLGVLVETLGEAGYELMVAEDGEEALAQTARTQPDLILLDVMMPGLDGFETCRRLKARAATRDVPVVFMTALHETTDKVKAFAAGGVDYITKPIEHEEALARVRTHLALRRLRRELEQQLAMQERFMRIASHDLRNPLCLILMAGGMAKRQPAVADSPALPAARGDAGLAYQAVTNLTSNALKFTPLGGNVTLATRATERGVRFEVRDNGPGVPAAERDQLFAEHARLSPQPTGGEESNGLGLAIVKHLVESLDGTVGAEFPAGGGSVFWFELPKVGAGKPPGLT